MLIAILKLLIELKIVGEIFRDVQVNFGKSSWDTTQFHRMSGMSIYVRISYYAPQKKLSFRLNYREVENLVRYGNYKLVPAFLAVPVSLVHAGQPQVNF